MSDDEKKKESLFQENIESHHLKDNKNLSFDGIMMEKKKSELNLEQLQKHESNDKFLSNTNIPIIKTPNNIDKTKIELSNNKSNISDNISVEEKDIVLSIDHEVNKMTPEKIYKSENYESERDNIQMINDRRETTKSNDNSKYKYCILCSSIPLITYFIPFVCHSCIVNSYGFIHDYFSSHFIRIFPETEKAFSKIVVLNLNDRQKNIFDDSIEKVDKNFKKKTFSICGSNSYKYIANILNVIEYNGKKNYSKCDIFWLIVKEGRYASNFQLFKTYLGWIILIILIILIIAFSV